MQGCLYSALARIALERQRIAKRQSNANPGLGCILQGTCTSVLPLLAFEPCHLNAVGLMPKSTEEASSPTTTTCKMPRLDSPAKPALVGQDMLETQAYEVDTQTFENVLEKLDCPVPSPGLTFAEQKTQIWGTTQAPTADAKAPNKVTPSPKSKPLIDITPMKTAPTRDDQLRLKLGKQEEKTKEEEEKAGGRGRGRGKGRGRGRGKGRGRGRGGKAEADDEIEQEEEDEGEEDVTATAPPSEPKPEPKKNQGGKSNKKKPEDDAKPSEEAPIKNKAGRPKKVKPTEEPEDEAKPKPTKKATPKAPMKRISSKRKVEDDDAGKPKPKPKPRAKKHDEATHSWPRTFARRYRPSNDSWMQRLWDGCYLAFQDVIAPNILPGQKTFLEARVAQT